jgi:hypothetical protein
MVEWYFEWDIMSLSQEKEKYKIKYMDLETKESCIRYTYENQSMLHIHDIIYGVHASSQPLSVETRCCRDELCKSSECLTQEAL